MKCVRGISPFRMWPFNGTFTRFKRESFSSCWKTCFRFLEITFFPIDAKGPKIGLVQAIPEFLHLPQV